MGKCHGLLAVSCLLAQWVSLCQEPCHASCHTNPFLPEQGRAGKQTASTWSFFLKVTRGSGLRVPISNLIASVDALPLLSIPDPPHSPPPIASFSLPGPITHGLFMLQVPSLNLKMCLPYPNLCLTSKAKRTLESIGCWDKTRDRVPGAANSRLLKASSAGTLTSPHQFFHMPEVLTLDSDRRGCLS